MWKCKRCGGEILMIITEIESKTYTIKKNYKKGKLIDKGGKTDYGVNYFCKDCGAYYGTDKTLEDVAYWEGSNEKN